MSDIKDPIEEATNGLEDKANEALKIAKELEEKINSNKKEEVVPDIDETTLINSPDFKAKAKELTGMTDAQVDFVVKTAGAASAQGNQRAAVAEVRGRHPDFSKFEEKINNELKQYPPEKRGNPEIIEKLYYVEKGRDAEKNNGRDSGNRPTIRGSGPSGQGLNHDDSRGGNEALSDEEKYVARKMGIPESEYNRSKGTKLIHELADKK